MPAAFTFAESVTSPECDFSAINEHHSLLVQLIERFEKAVTLGRLPDIKEHLERFLKLMALHFATEERVMLATRYPGFAAHRQDHFDTLAAIRGFDADYRAGHKKAARKALRFLLDWESVHVHGADAAFELYLFQNKESIKPSPKS